jgi:hypothetical protein
MRWPSDCPPVATKSAVEMPSAAKVATDQPQCSGSKSLRRLRAIKSGMNTTNIGAESINEAKARRCRGAMRHDLTCTGLPISDAERLIWRAA